MPVSKGRELRLGKPAYFDKYSSSYCHWRTEVHAEISRAFHLLAKRQPPSRRSGAMARREGGGTGAIQNASRISGILVSRAASWTAAALRRFSQRHIKLCQCELETDCGARFSIPKLILIAVSRPGCFVPPAAIFYEDHQPEFRH
jgi:hypothetical protein